MPRNFGHSPNDEPKPGERGYSSPDAFESWTGQDDAFGRFSPSLPAWIVGIVIAAILVGGALLLK